MPFGIINLWLEKMQTMFAFLSQPNACTSQIFCYTKNPDRTTKNYNIRYHQD
ncbi:putative orfan [Tupanvirus soda lake]|uniref:Orfan n=2 Tax=Tupanvirus TaxID=2094720 RepID=A0AC62AD23_9VIRU|nr:putative orfan [Tupanvirus soda lake]QKU35629.1 putative orfan [Tupanvirus soda lake]